ncbi:MAG: hypothetical protein E7517_05470 [Ruminococcaceae bacterium]|nr:hypothetical protein [Oscillospiraceae bacterium]
MVDTLIKLVTKALEITKKLTEVFTYILTGYEKVEEKRAELDDKVFKWARYLIMGVLSCGVILVVIFIIRKICKCCKKRKEKKLKKQLEKQLALEV